MLGHPPKLRRPPLAPTALSPLVRPTATTVAAAGVAAAGQLLGGAAAALPYAGHSSGTGSCPTQGVEGIQCDIH